MYKQIKLIINGPSGVGKTTIIYEILKRRDDFDLSISYTTRPMRDFEKHGQEYFFITEEKFLELYKSDFFIEIEKNFDNYYGSPRVDYSKHIIFNVGSGGVEKLQDIYPDIITIFIAPPSITELKNRLENRSIGCVKRFENILKQMQPENADYIVINDNLENTIVKILNIIDVLIYNNNSKEILKNIIESIN